MEIVRSTSALFKSVGSEFFIGDPVSVFALKRHWRSVYVTIHRFCASRLDRDAKVLFLQCSD
jgi:hypothetical protein